MTVEALLAGEPVQQLTAYVSSTPGLGVVDGLPISGDHLAAAARSEQSMPVLAAYLLCIWQLPGVSA